MGGDFLGLCEQKLSIHHGSYSQRLLCHRYFSISRKRTPVNRACTSWSVIIRNATLNSWRAMKTNSIFTSPLLWLHRALLNLYIVHSPTNALFIKHVEKHSSWSVNLRNATSNSWRAMKKNSIFTSPLLWLHLALLNLYIVHLPTNVLSIKLGKV